MNILFLEPGKIDVFENTDVIEYKRYNVLHRDNDLPARIHKITGSCEYFINGRLSRHGGKPAVIHADGIFQYYLNGIEYFPRDYDELQYTLLEKSFGTMDVVFYKSENIVNPKVIEIQNIPNISEILQHYNLEKGEFQNSNEKEYSYDIYALLVLSRIILEKLHPLNFEFYIQCVHGILEQSSVAFLFSVSNLGLPITMKLISFGLRVPNKLRIVLKEFENLSFAKKMLKNSSKDDNDLYRQYGKIKYKEPMKILEDIYSTIYNCSCCIKKNYVINNIFRICKNHCCS